MESLNPRNRIILADDAARALTERQGLAQVQVTPRPRSESTTPDRAMCDSYENLPCEPKRLPEFWEGAYTTLNDPLGVNGRVRLGISDTSTQIGRCHSDSSTTFTRLRLRERARRPPCIRRSTTPWP